MYPKTRELIEEFQKEGVFPGTVYGFMEGDKVENHVLGLAQVVPEKVTMQEEMLFDVASLTKVVCTTTVVLKLMEAGRLRVDEPLHHYLPEFVNNTITLRHLLTHTSDIQTYIPHRDTLNQEELRQAYYKLEPGDQLGKKIQYTDAGTILLAFMLEKIYQKPAIEIFRDEVLTPLGMISSTFLPGARPDVVPTAEIPGIGFLKGVTHDPKARVLAEHAGNAGLFTNIADLEKFARMLLNSGESGGKQFLQASTVGSLLQNWTLAGEGNRSLGWKLLTNLADTHPILSHTGYTGTFLMIDVVDQSAFIFLSNRVHLEDRRRFYIERRNAIIETYLREKKLRKS